MPAQAVPSVIDDDDIVGTVPPVLARFLEPAFQLRRVEASSVNDGAWRIRRRPCILEPLQSILFIVAHYMLAPMLLGAPQTLQRHAIDAT